ncbi:MAG: peptidylprolyl isomerase, partial [Candidatus Entotheonellia bacterium]
KDEIRQAVVEQKERAFVAAYLKDLKERASLQIDYSLLEVPEPVEQELLTYYQNNRERFRVPERAKIAQIQVSVSLSGTDNRARAKAESARARATAGEDFAQLAQELSDGPEKADGGELANLVALGSRSQAFDEAVFPLPVGELSPVFKEGDSYYVVKLLERWPERLQPYEEVRSQIASLLRAEREQQVYQERATRTLFSIHGRRTTLGEFVQELNELPPEVQAQYTGPEGKRKILEALIERLLVVEDASEQATDVKRKEEIQHARSDLLGRLLHQEEVDEQVKVSDAEVRAEYERNKARYADPPRVKVRYIRVSRGLTRNEDQKARAKIEAAESKLKPVGLFGGGGQPADFAEVARQYSEDAEAAANGSDLDRWIGESGNPIAELFEHPLHQELLPLKVGDFSPILPIDDSYYLFQIREKQEGRSRPFEDVQGLVRRRLEARKHEELTRQMERDLLDRMQLQIYDSRIQRVLDELGGAAAGRR